MNFRQKLTLYLLLYILPCTPLFAQAVDIPDANLRAAIQQDLNLPPNTPITRDDMRRLVTVRFHGRGISDLSGIEFATELRSLSVTGNEIADISPLANLTQITTLVLAWNRIVDITLLANLTQLTYLDLSGNGIIDVTPLSNLTRLEYLEIQQNSIWDHSPLDGLALTHFEYDDNQVCNEPQLSLQERLEKRNMPSVYQPWGREGASSVLNQPHLSDFQQIAQHDLWWCFPAFMFGGILFDVGDAWVMGGDVDAMIRRRDDWIEENPNMIFLIQLPVVGDDLDRFPPDSEYWLRDEHGEIVSRWDAGLLNLNHPGLQKRLIDQAAALSQCGLYDGIFIDGWNESHFNDSGYLGGVEALLRGIRERVHDNFLILVNTNRRTAPVAAPYINGLFLESGVPENIEDPSEGFTILEETLSWAENNLRAPRINAPQGRAYSDEPLDSPGNLRWMRAVTTLSLTFSDGFTLITTDWWEGVHRHWHYWYDFWDADLGQPVGAKSQLYQETEGLYIREFTNGWAVYNHSGAERIVTLPEETKGVASHLEGFSHTLANLDGEMYLRVKPVNPADVNEDGVVNVLDLIIVAQAIGADGAGGDVNGDGVVNVFDLVFVANQF